jgi:hypothetical protein
MARILKKPGDIFRVPLSGNRIGYAQWLPDGTARYFLAAHSSEASLSEIGSIPTAFRVLTYGDTPGRYGWVKIGKLPVPPEFSTPQRYAKRDSLSGKLSVYYEGEEKDATLAELKGLETLAAWAHPHIVERLEAQLDGRESAFLKSIQVA